MAGLVDGDASSLIGVEERLARVAEDDLVHRRREVLRRDGFGAPPRRGECRLVAEIRQVGAREAGCARRELVQGHVGRERLVLRVEAQDGLARLVLGSVDHDPSVEATGTQERCVEHVGPVRGREDDREVGPREAVELGQ